MSGPLVEGRSSSQGGNRGRIFALLVAPTAVLVAAIMLMLRLHFQPPTVPSYELLGDAGGVVVLDRGPRFAMEIAPSLEVQGAVTARAFLVRGSEVRPWKAPLEIGRDGSVHLEGRVDALFAGVPPGEWDVVLVVGRPEMLPNDPRDVLRSAPADGGAAWRLVRERVRVPE